MKTPIRIPLIPLSSEDEERVKHVAQLCLEIWNACILQRSNKYSWGKADKESQLQEIADIQTLLPEYAAIPSSVLSNIIAQVDQTYLLFFKSLNDFKAKQSPKKPTPPAPLSETNSIALVYSPADHQLSQNQLQLFDQTRWLRFALTTNHTDHQGPIALYCSPDQISMELRKL